MIFKKTAMKLAVMAAAATIALGGTACLAEETPTEAASEAPAPETSAPEMQPPETQPPETQPPETQPPETQPPATEAPVQETAPSEAETTGSPTESGSAETVQENHSTAIPDNPREKRINVNVVDAHETDETETEDGFAAAFEAGEAVLVAPEASFAELLAAVGHPIGDAETDVVLRGLGIRRRFDSYAAGSAGTIFRKAKASNDGICEIAVSYADGSHERLKAAVAGSAEEKTAAVMISREQEKRTYSIGFDAGSGVLSGPSGTTRERGEAFGIFDAEASKEGEDFCGWYVGKSPAVKRVLPTDRVYGDEILTAYYAKYGTVTCSFDLGFVPEGEEESLKYELPYPVKTDGTYDADEYPMIRRKGYEFDGWVDENGEAAVLRGRTEPGIFTAKWKEKEETPEETRIDGLSTLACPSAAGR